MRLLILSVALALTPACASSAPQGAPVVAAAPAAPVTGEAAFLQITERVSDRVHVLRQAVPNFAGVVGNVTIIEQSDSLVLVDTGNTRGTGDRVVAAIRALSNKPVSAVIITHWHNDHPLGLPAIVEAWPNVEIIATEATAAHLSAGETTVPTERDAEYEARRTQRLTVDYPPLLTGYMNAPDISREEREGWERALAALPLRARDEIGTYLILPNRTFTDTIRLDDSVAPIEISFLGAANTDGDLIVYLPRQRIVVAGDMVVAPIPYMFAVAAGDYVRTLQRLRTYEFDTLIPGHGEPMRGKAYIDQLIAFIGDTQAQTTALAQEGLTVEDVTARVNLETHAQAFAGDDPWLRVWFRDYAASPLIDSVYREVRPE